MIIAAIIAICCKADPSAKLLNSRASSETNALPFLPEGMLNTFFLHVTTSAYADSTTCVKSAPDKSPHVKRGPEKDGGRSDEADDKCWSVDWSSASVREGCT